jgi:hypothetical protein
MTRMDWTGYPINLPAEAPVETYTDLGAVLGRSGPFWDALGEAFGAAEGADVERLAFAFPREYRAWNVWRGYEIAPTAEALVSALAAIPDPPEPDPDVELLPVALTRLQANQLPTTEVAATLMYRETPTSGNVTKQWRVPPASVEIDPRLLTAAPPPAVLTVRLTVAEPEQGQDA